MSHTSHDYNPISCDFYDVIEIAAMRKNWVSIEYKLDDDIVLETTKILNTVTKKKVEYAITQDGHEIRMDFIKNITTLNPAIDMRVNLLEKLEYNQWANQKVWKHLDSIEDYPSEVSLKLSHIICAHDIWNKRILQMSPRFQVWEDIPMEEWQELLTETNRESKDILTKSQLDRVVKYTNTMGEQHISTIADIIYHVINHSTYHRGQISDLLSNAGKKGIPTDYILYSRIK